METGCIFSCLQCSCITQTNKIVIAFTSASTLPMRLNCCECMTIWLTPCCIIDLFRRILLCSCNYVASPLSCSLAVQRPSDVFNTSRLNQYETVPTAQSVKVLVSFSNQLARILTRSVMARILWLPVTVLLCGDVKCSSLSALRAFTWIAQIKMSPCFITPSANFVNVLNLMQTPFYRSANFWGVS